MLTLEYHEEVAKRIEREEALKEGSYRESEKDCYKFNPFRNER